MNVTVTSSNSNSDEFMIYPNALLNQSVDENENKPQLLSTLKVFIATAVSGLAIMNPLSFSQIQSTTTNALQMSGSENTAFQTNVISSNSSMFKRSRPSWAIVSAETMKVSNPEIVQEINSSSPSLLNYFEKSFFVKDSNVVSFDSQPAYGNMKLKTDEQSTIEKLGAANYRRAELMLEKLIKNRDFVEKQGVNIGIALAVILMVIPIVSQVPFSATFPSVVLSISLAGFMLMRRKLRG
ncbi:hypothetical protein [Paenibacillus sp. NPDC058177]|uniref:hypothetical protein n=1 Tax=Paenibacillus sp. NPDC058177 TaxID=3346369 RepID=UPI0036D816B0